jgi:hypothetical protein
LTREQIDAAEDLPTRAVPVPEWGGDVLLRTLTGKQRDDFEQGQASLPANGKLDNIRARLVALCLVDGDGKQLYADHESILRLGGRSGTVLDRLFDVCREMNGMTAESAKAAEKNS